MWMEAGDGRLLEWDIGIREVMTHEQPSQTEIMIVSSTFLAASIL
jgi:hypothetical protein